LLLANMEEKMPVLEHLYKQEPTAGLPATFLKYHKNARWLLDKDAAGELPHEKTPWKIKEVRWTRELMRQAAIEIFKARPRLVLKGLDQAALEKIGVPYPEVVIAKGAEAIQKDISGFLDDSIFRGRDGILPLNSRVLIFSPHPDDDAITMAATVRALKKRGNDIWIVYMVSGENAVRNSFKAAHQKYQEVLKRAGEKQPTKERAEEYLRLARIEVRREEAMRAAGFMGLSSSRLFFLNLPYYYHRGLIDIDPIDPARDVSPVRKIILSVRPQHIFYSAEADPHGAHGLCAKIVAQAFEKLPQFWSSSFWGYRGAYEEWPLYRPEGLVVVPFDKKLMDLKIKCIKSHVSQLDPVFPSYDHREFWERARDRNRATGRLLEQMGYLRGGPHYAEVFRRISYAEFIRTR
jgi:glucosamine-6-phosphate deaminase